MLVQKGRALLAPDNTTIFPHSLVEELDVDRDVKFSRGLRVRLGYTVVFLFYMSEVIEPDFFALA